MDNERRAQLLNVKLRSIVSTAFDHADGEELAPVPYFAGAAVVHRPTNAAFVLVDSREVDADPTDREAQVARPVRGWLGGAIVAATRVNASSITILADVGTLDGNDVRRAQRAACDVSVYEISGRDASLLRPVAYTEPVAPSVEEMMFQTTIREAGAVAIVEDGVLKAEVLGLEVGRVTTDEFGVRLEVGVGRHDRLAQSMMNAQTEPVLALRSAVELVLERRAANQPPHPANTVSRSRWLREHLIDHPDLVGAESASRTNGTVHVELKRSSVAIATARATNGQEFVVGCAVGADLDAVTDLLDASCAPAVAIHEAIHKAIDARFVLVVPVGDDLPALRELCVATRPVVELVAVTAPWS
jgi:hypothetical protein